MEISEKDMQRFESKINKTNDCWLWSAGHFKSGYGAFGFERKVLYSHRFSYMLSNGNIPDNLDVRHKCRYKNCVNPEHLELGTHAENMKDTIRDKTSTRGTKHPKNKLTETQVREIRLSNKSQKEIAKEYRVDPSTISDIKRRLIWGWLD